MELFTPKWKSNNPKKRIIWIEKAKHYDPKHQAILIELGKNDENQKVSIEAIQKLTDQNALADIAKNAKDYFTRKTAYKKLGKKESQEALADSAKNDINDSVRQEAAYKLTDQNALADIAKNDKDKFVRAAAVSKLTDQDFLVDLAKGNANDTIRIAALIGLKNIVLKSGKSELFKQIFDISLELIETKDRGEDISELVIPLKELYESNLLSVADKNKILSLNGKLFKEHGDASHSDSEFCRGFHNDSPHVDSDAIYFNL